MSTRANITFYSRGKELYTIPVWSDGYPSGIGPHLVEALKKSTCRSIRNARGMLKLANMFVIEERVTDYRYEVDVSGDEFAIAVYYGSRKKPMFEGDPEEFAAWMNKH